jgi:acylphosphatase
MRKRLHLRVYGRVQGVFYRASARDKARSLLLSGFARNCPDGSVEILAEGEEAQLGALLHWSRQGPPAAEVERVDASWSEAMGDLLPFMVRH